MKEQQYILLAGAAVLVLVIVIIICRSRRKDPYPYERRPLLSQNEQTLYTVLKKVADKEGLMILIKMRLADIMAVRADARDYMEAFNKIKAKHTDFILVDPYTMDVVAGVELDDPSHLKKDREERDIFVDGAYRACGIPLLHVWNPVTEEELREAVRRVL